MDGAVDGQDTLQERYGGPRDSRRRVLIGVSVAVGTAFAAWLAWATYAFVTPEVTSSLDGFEVVDDSTVTAVVVVDLAEGVGGATCRVRAFSEDHSNVGEVAFTPDATGATRQSVTIRTERRATAVESLGCTTADQSRPR